MTGKRVLSTAFLILVAAAMVMAQNDIPLRNWTVPAYSASGFSGGFQTMDDVTPAVAFIGVAPCRLVDTRGGGPWTGAYGPPNLAAGAPRNFDLNSAAHCPGIPAGVEAYSLNITVTLTAGTGFLKVWPQGSAEPTVSTINYVGGQTIANAAIVPAGSGGGITVVAGVAATHVIIDINGYFSDEYNPGQLFGAHGNAGAFDIIGIPFPGTVASISNAATSWSYALNVRGDSTANGGAAINAVASGDTGAIAAVEGFSDSANDGAAGVRGTGDLGVIGSQDSANCPSCLWSGVRGESRFGSGVLGLSRGTLPSSAGVVGIFFDSNLVEASWGALGYDLDVGVRSAENITKGGTVSFTEPHATDASKKLQYVALEGNEAGTYFRGRGKFDRGVATIEVPEDFRMVTQPDGLSIQVTAIGDMATVAVSHIGLDRIVVRGSRNVEFFYTVNGIRRGYGDFKPIVENDKDYLPDGPNAVMPASLSAELRSRLVANGTYKADGTVNMETAKRLGWDRMWEEQKLEREQPSARATPE